MTTPPPILETLFEPLGECLTPEVARRIAELRAPAAVQLKMEEYATRSTEGTLDSAEAEEYRTLISAGSFIALLQAKARGILKSAAE